MGKENYLRVPITMPRELYNYLEQVSQDAKESGGYKLPNTTIVRALIKVMMDLEVDVSGVKDEDQLKERIMQARRKSF